MGAQYLHQRMPDGLFNPVRPDLAFVVSTFRGDAFARRAINDAQRH
jgi:hypothetical protein